MKGICTIQLIDDATKQVIQEVTDENMMTNAIRNVMNPSPMFFANDGDYKTFVNGNFPIAKTALGGVLLWSEQLPEDANYIIHDNPLDLVGHAGNDAYSGYNQLRGSYNTTESGATDTGYKHVWDFATNQGNGIIRCVSLTSAWGGKSGLLGTVEDYPVIKPIYYGQNLENNLSNPAFYNRICNAGFSFSEIENNEFYAFKRIDADKAAIRKYSFEYLKAKTNTSMSPILIDEYEVSTVNAFYNLPTTPRIFKSGDNLLIFHQSSTKIRKITINVSSKGVAFTEHTMTGEIPTDGQMNWKAYYYDEKLYHHEYLSKKMLIIDCKTWVSTKVGDTQTSECSIFKLGNAICFMQMQHSSMGGNDRSASLYYLNGEIIEGNCRLLCMYTAYNPRLSSAMSQKPYMILTSGSTGGESYLFVGLYAPYIATIDNLSTPITKTASQSMKVIYTLTDV